MTFSTDRILSVSAMVIGIGSLFAVIYQTHLMRQAQNASALPYLMIALNASEDGAFLAVRNAGVGPAVIDDVVVRYQGREIKGDAYDFYMGLKRPESPNVDVDKIIPGRLIPAGETIRMLGASRTRRPAMLNELLRLFEIAEVPRTWLVNSGVPLSSADRAVLEITYSSVYGYRWRLSSDRVVPQEF